MGRNILRIFAVFFGLLAISNMSKPLELTHEVGFVFLGRRLRGTADLLVAPLFGAYLAAYAYGLWNARRFALPMGILYAGWVPLNMYLFTIRSPEEMGVNSLFGVKYMIVAMGISWGAMIALMLHAKNLK
jgi:hypothetical protein